MSDRRVPAKPEQILSEVSRIINVTKPPKDMPADKLVDGYVEALGKFSIVHIREVVTRFCDGGYAPSISSTWAPMPLELAQLVRDYASARQRPDGAPGQKFTFNVPRSRVLHWNMSKDRLRQLVDEGVAPRGSIWLPGDPGSERFGTVYEPDPNWRGARPLGEGAPAK